MTIAIVITIVTTIVTIIVTAIVITLGLSTTGQFLLGIISIFVRLTQQARHTAFKDTCQAVTEGSCNVRMLVRKNL